MSAEVGLGDTTPKTHPELTLNLSPGEFPLPFVIILFKNDEL